MTAIFFIATLNSISCTVAQFKNEYSFCFFLTVCKKEVDARFDQPKDKWSVKNYGDGWISTYNAMIKNVTKNGNYYAAFEGTTGMEVWRYDHNVFKEVTMKLTFQRTYRQFSIGISPVMQIIRIVFIYGTIRAVNEEKSFKLFITNY